MVHDIILRFGTPEEGGPWAGSGFQVGRLYDLRREDIVFPILNGATNWPPGTDVRTSKVPDSVKEISTVPEIKDQVQALRRSTYTLEDIPGITEAAVTALKAASYNTPSDLVGVSKATLVAINGVDSALADSIIAWLEKEGYND